MLLALLLTLVLLLKIPLRGTTDLGAKNIPVDLMG